MFTCKNTMFKIGFQSEFKNMYNNPFILAVCINGVKN